jgi:succinate dehydrogenase hydrophobic anchor subunit
VNRRLLLPLGIGVTVLLVLAGIASHGRPLRSGHRGAGPSTTFFDYVFTTVALVALLIAAIVVWTLLTNSPTRAKAGRGRRNVFATLLFIALCAALAYAISTSGFERRLQDAIRRSQTAQTQTQATVAPATAPKNGRGAHFRWDEAAIVLGLLGGLAVLALVERSRRRPPPISWRRSSQQAVSLALDESLDDLRNEPDLRRAIVAAYARMERALAAVGLARRPAEAPLEYLERALRELETSGEAIRRLTHLFEWAKFSQHEPEPQMRDEAVDALEAVRDELRAPRAEEAVPA